MSDAQATVDDLPPGTIVAGRYRIGERLGEGAIGAVYYAEHTTVQRAVAIKVLSRQWLGNAQMVERFRSEARSASAAGHPNIIDVFDAGELDNGLPFIVMEYIAGQQLYDILRQEQGMDLERTCRLGRDVARALAAAHERGIVHRDLKAENVMIVERDGAETVKVLDFGVAHIGTLESRRTTPGMVIGTPEYMAPEQVRGSRPTPAIDTYALGVLLFEMLSGSPPFDAAEPIDLLAMKTSGPAPSIATRRDDLPHAMIDLVDECLDMAPERRPSTESVARRLQAILDRSIPLVTGRHPKVRRRANALWLGIGAGALLVVAAIVVAGQSEADSVEPPPAIAAAPARAPEPPEPDANKPEPSAPVPSAPVPSAPEPEAPEPHAEVAEPSTPTPATPTGKKRPPKPTQPLTEPKPPEPTPPPETKATTTAVDSDSLECRQTRKRAQQAREVQDWPGVLRNTDSGACWASKLERQKLRVKAYLESGNNASCIAAGKGSDDRDIVKWVALCEKRSAG